MGLNEHKQESQAPLAFAVCTVSDTRRGAEDTGGAYLVEAAEKAGHRVLLRDWVSDDRDAIVGALERALGHSEVQVVLFTGGTGFAQRDVTVPALSPRFDADVPGFGELFRALSYQQIGSAAILSRACAGIAQGRLVVALPGSVKALRLAWERILQPEAGHFLSQLGR